MLLFFLISAHLYAALLDDVVMLQRRGIELHEFYAKKIYAEEHYEVMTTPLDHTHPSIRARIKIMYIFFATRTCMYMCIHAFYTHAHVHVTPNFLGIHVIIII